MTAYEKPTVTTDDVRALAKEHFGKEADGVTPLAGGNLSNAFAFAVDGRAYVVKFSELKDAYRSDRFVSELLAGREGIVFPKCLALGTSGGLNYIIMERLGGSNLGDGTPEEQARHVPELAGMLAELAKVDVGATTGFGWIGPDGNGAYGSWTDFAAAVNAEDQTGTFWENWHELYRTSCLEKDVVDEIYARLMVYAPYNGRHRQFVHGDFHQWNILSDGGRVTGIIDGLWMYGDSLVDLATLDRHMPWAGVVQAYRERLERAGTELPDFRERLLGAYYFKGLIGLRFFAKMEMKEAYLGTRQFLLGLES